MVCTNCGRLVAGPALSIHVTAEAAVVHEGRVFRAADRPIISDWLICQECYQGGSEAGLHLAGFIKVMADGLAKATGR